MLPEKLHDLLKRAAVDHGNRTAIEFEGQHLTYAQLMDASDRLAALLLKCGAEPGQRIAFCFPKSIDAIVAMLATIRTGAAYVPLDPAWPADRMMMICEDAGIGLWLGSAPPPREITGIETALVSDPGESNTKPIALWKEHDPPNDLARVPENDVANILYTSGSTGRPKGVQITARSLLHFSQWVVDEFGLTPEDRLANHAPYNFDLSTLDIFAAVRAGAAMYPVPERLKMFPYQMAKFITDHRITVWYSVPSALVMMQLRGKLSDHDFSHLRHVIFAGEIMPKPALQALAGELPHTRLTNLYGPTETNVCTYYRVDQAELNRDEPVPIGVPISDTQLWIMDHEGRVVDDGASGELWVSGPTVTSGYFGDPELTSARLVPAPNGDGLAYRTGDRVRRREDGILLFEGRIDRMIKCRGHRIEPGEIEATLHRHPAVKEAAVVPIPDPVFGNRLKACVAPKEGSVLEEASLVAFCRNHLPAYMMPDIWEFLTTLPRTDREKVDLQALMS